MTEATWGESAKTPEINWRMSASLENVARGDNDVAECHQPRAGSSRLAQTGPTAPSCGRPDGGASRAARRRLQHDVCR